MKILYSQLLDFLDIKPDKDTISKKLFQLGHEHEIDGNIFDMELTPNRGDCLSLLGLSRDLNVFFGNSNSLGYYNEKIKDLNLNFKNNSLKDCPRASFLEIEVKNINIKYRSYLENYFKEFNLNKTNFFTDISNYLLYECGQPTHCYDSEKIGNDLTFAIKDCSEKFETLHGNIINLKGNNCVFISNNKIVSLAGVMGGKSTSCSKNTTKALVECAFFNPESIIGKSIKYNLNSEAAYRFERGVDPNCHEKILRRFIKIVSENAEIVNLSMSIDNAYEFNPVKLNLDESNINRILGTNINKDKYIHLLKKLGFTLDNKIIVPSYRHDINSKNDLSEEIARVVGYDNISRKPIKLSKNATSADDSRISKIQSFLTDNCFNEVINFPFTSDNSDGAIKVDNPLDSNRPYLRTSLKNHLVENLLYNERRQQDSIKLFEISDIYTEDSEHGSQKKLGIIMSGRRGHNYKDFSKKIDKEFIKNIFKDSINIDELFEEIPRSELDTKIKDKIFYCETDLSEIPQKFLREYEIEKKPINFNSYKPISSMPSSTRDISFAVKDSKALELLMKEVDAFKSDFLKKSFIFDYFINNKQNEIKIGYRFVFQSKDRSLNIEDIEREIFPLIENTTNISGVSIPGL